MENETNVFAFDVVRVLDCGFSIEEMIDPTDGNIQTGYGMNFTFDVENSWVQMIVRVDLNTIDTDKTFISGTVLTRFGINNLKGFIDENNLVNFPKGSLETLFGIAFTHMRAIFAKNISGSRFTNIIVPVINPNELFPELLNLSIEKFKQFMGEKDLAKGESVDFSNFQIKHD